MKFVNWKTTTCAILVAASAIVQFTLEHSTDLQSAFGPVVTAKIYTVALLLKNFAIPLGLLLAKDWNSTGGTVPATPEAVIRIDQPAVPMVSLPPKA